MSIRATVQHSELQRCPDERNRGVGTANLRWTSTLLISPRRLFNGADYADAKIYIGQVELPSHRLVLATQSKYFKTAFKSSLVEGNTHVIKFETGSGHAYWRVLEYMYTGKYSEEPAAALPVEGMHSHLTLLM